MQLGKYLLGGSLFADEAAGGGGGGTGGVTPPPGLDPKTLADAIKAVLTPQLADLGKRLEGFETRFRTQDQKAADEAQRAEEARQAAEDAAAEAAKKAAGGGGGGAGDGTGMDAQAKLLQRQLDRVQKQLEEEKKLREATQEQAKQRDRENKIRSALDKFDYAKPIGKELAYRHVDPMLKSDENGELVTPDGSALNLWLKDLFEGDLDTLAAPRSGVGGSGASGSRGGVTSTKIDMSAIRAGGKDLEAARALVSQLARDVLGGRQ